MEFDYGIGSFNEQPMRFTFFHDGRMRTYTPDFQVTFCDPLRIEIHEVKKLEYLKGPDVAARLAAAKLCIESQGYIFKTVTEVEIRRQPRLRNIGLALRYRDWDEAERPDLDQRLPVVDTAITLQALTTPHRWQSALPYLIDGRLLADLDHPLSAETKVWRP
ncbi:TnsA endonuclease N-terminal domain-containing protein [Paramagnetospirillum magnetotacticum]|uniref:TnsA endonuclease N-terminal domain-containing protein n=1 Tax=Paramagnetospirillum magnetotacticum TaxID=188 RepID=UPI001364DABD|nr:TnsA endonuclease N-terminal domain-containing protein [Paramagnetospirillum magnetotacticum]